MKQSLKTQLVTLFLVILAGVFAACILANSLFLEKYYTYDNKKKLKQIYEQLSDGSETGILSDENFQLSVERECEAFNISIILLNDGEEYSFSKIQNGNFMKDRLFRYQFFDDIGPDGSDLIIPEDVIPPGRFMMSEEEIVTLEETENYTLVKILDSKSGSSYMEMWGNIDTDSPFAMRIPLETTARCASIANRFIVFVSAAAAVVGLFLLLIFIRRFLRPVEELTSLSEKMADLDFDARYTGGGTSEIAILGDNFNRMSESLELAMRDLKSANLTLQKDLEMKDLREERRKEFLANVSHEMKTPLAVIQGYAEGLQSPIGEDEEKRNHYSQIIVDEVEKMNTMLKNLLNLSELESQALQMERFDIHSLIDGTVEANRMCAEQENIILNWEHKEPCFVWGDPYCIEQVLTNYISNAIRYAGGENKYIHVYTEERSDNLLRILVHNSGDPIKEEDMPRIWEKFYKIDKVRSRSKGGTGIGLSIVKAVMDQHGQSYGVLNEKDGVTFWFELSRK